MTAWRTFYKPALLIPILLSAASYLIYFWGCEQMGHSIGVQKLDYPLYRFLHLGGEYRFLGDPLGIRDA